MATAEKIDHIIDFAIYLQRSLLRSDQPINDLSLQFKSLPLHHKNLSPSSRIKLNKHGVALWNVCSRSRQTEQFLARKELFAQARFFAYLLLESAAEADFDSLKNALTVGKECLYTGLLELTLKILEKTAALLEALATSNAYVAEYLLLRLALAWRQDRLDLAEHFFTKLQAEAAQTMSTPAKSSGTLLLQCLLKQSEPAEARGAALKMSPNVARHPLSLYLTYCIATRLGDEDLAQDVFKQANSDGVILACLCETLRYQLEDAQKVEQTCTRTCKVFETVATYIHKSSSFLLLEKNWVAMASLCLAQKFYKKWPTHSIIQLLEHAATLFDVSTVTSVAGEDMRLAEDFERRHVTSLFALAILHTKEARISESAEARIAKYSNARECAHMCGEHLNSFLVRDGFHIAPQRSSSKNVYLQLVVQLTTLLLVKFEASLCIPEKEGAPNAIVARLLELIIEAAELNAPMSTYATFVDMILWAVSGGYQNTGPLISADTAVHILHQLIKAAQGTEQYSVLLTARWIRHLVLLIVSNSKQVTEGDNMSLIVDVVEQVLVLAAPRTSPQDDGEGVLVLGAAYPAGELEWLATTLFNLAVDYYLGEKEELGKKWAGKAVGLADVLAAIQGANADGGLLARVLRGKMGDLGWSE